MRWSTFADLIKESFESLFPGRECPFVGDVRYSGHFNGYNGNIRKSGSVITLNLSKNWRRVSKDIQLGIAQELLLKILSRYSEYRSISPRSSVNIDLYHNFLRSVHIAIPKTEEDPLLRSFFDRLNDRFFFGAMDTPNLRWGQESYRKLGSYDFGTDTITMSQALNPDITKDPELLEYVLYHEMLHKKHKFSSSGRRTRSHTRAFRVDESRFPNAKGCEFRLKSLRPSFFRNSSRNSRRTSRAPSHPFERLLELMLR